VLVGGEAVLVVLASYWDIGHGGCNRSLGDFQDVWYLAAVSSYRSLSALLLNKILDLKYVSMETFALTELNYKNSKIR